MKDKKSHQVEVERCVVSRLRRRTMVRADTLQKAVTLLAIQGIATLPHLMR